MRFLGATPAHASDLTSASYTARAGHIVGAASGVLIGTIHSTLGSAGQAEAVGWYGAATSLATQGSGFWPIVRGRLPSLDRDGDGIQAFLDDDDDGDGLFDVVETNTGIFVSASDTGTDPLKHDSDGDGLSDGFEVANGSNPNDPFSPPVVPALSYAARIVLAGLLVGRARRSLALKKGTR
jgi:hypothetical protein